MNQFRFGCSQLALGRIQRRFASVHLRGRRKILALGIVHFLLGHDARLSLEDSVQSRVLKMERVVLRIVAFQFMIGAGDLVHRVLDLGLIFL